MEDQPQEEGKVDKYLQPQHMGTLLTTMLAACDENIEQMAKDQPTTKVGIVCFESSVLVYGDGTKPMFQVNENQIHNEAIMENVLAQHVKTFVSKPLSESCNFVRQRLMQCRDMGITALGPGVFTSTLIAKEHGLGSNVVICTDGMANAGPNDDNFYRRMG